MKIRRFLKGFTLIELLVVISIIAVLASLAVPAVTGAMVKGQLMQAVNNAHQIHIATMQMASDASTNSDSTIGWPGDVTSVSTAVQFVQLLVNNNYLNAGDAKVFAAAGIPAMTGTNISTFAATNCAYNIYKVKDNDLSNTIFLSTKNYKDGDAQAAFSTGTAAPFGNKGIVICRKGGDAGVYKTVTSATASYIIPTAGATPLN